MNDNLFDADKSHDDPEVIVGREFTDVVNGKLVDRLQEEKCLQDYEDDFDGGAYNPGDDYRNNKKIKEPSEPYGYN